MDTKTSLGLVVLASTLAVGGLALPARAAADDTATQGQSGKNHQGAKPGKPHPGKPDTDVSVVIVINPDQHRQVVRDYFTSGSLPPGLAKRESLPPGLRKQLREKGTLPPGLQKHLVAVPPALAARLPAVPPYYTRYFAGRDLIVVDTRTNRFVSVILDILQ